MPKESEKMLQSEGNKSKFILFFRVFTRQRTQCHYSSQFALLFITMNYSNHNVIPLFNAHFSKKIEIISVVYVSLKFFQWKYIWFFGVPQGFGLVYPQLVPGNLFLANSFSPTCSLAKLFPSGQPVPCPTCSLANLYLPSCSWAILFPGQLVPWSTCSLANLFSGHVWFSS